MAETHRQTRFLNVDLDIRAGTDLDEILAAMPSVLVLHSDATNASVELGHSPESVEEAVLGFAEIIRAMPRRARDAWRKCEHRVLNAGIQAGTGPYEAYFALSNDAVSALAKTGAGLTLTIYGSALTRESTTGEP